jgi:hypothetical protein
MGALPPNPRDLSLSRQDSWTGRRVALALPESRPLSRRSGCVSAEPYPPLRSVQSTRDEERGRLHKKLDASRGLALGAASIATRVEYFDAMSAPVALIEMTAQDRSPAVTNVSERFPVLAR